MRILFGCCAFAAVLAAVACTKDGPTSPSGPPERGASIVYSAVGASDVMGYNSSRPCDIFADCDGTGYPWVASRQLRTQGYSVSVFNLGIPSGVLSRGVEEISQRYGIGGVAGNIVDRGAPFVRNNSTLVTIFAGANDANVIVTAAGRGAGGANPTAFLDQAVADFGRDYVALIDSIKAQARAARIIVVNLPNMAASPYVATATLLHKQALQRVSVRMTTTAINTLPGVTVIDLMCDSRFYQSGAYSSDGFHLSDAGNRYIGEEIARALTGTSYPPPPASCSRMTLF